jgi:hypothetical protein
MRKFKIFSGHFSAAAMLAMTVLVAGCNMKQNSGDVSKELADKLTDSMNFANGEKKSGEKPLGHSGDPSYPQISNVIVEQNGNLYESNFKWKAAFDYQGAVTDITGAIVHVASATSYFDVKVSVQQKGELVVLTGSFSAGSQDIIGKNFIVELALYTARGAGGYYEQLTVTPQKGQPSAMNEPNAAQDAFLFEGEGGQPDSFAGVMPDGTGEMSGAPQISEVLMPAAVKPGQQFEVEIPFVYSGGAPAALLFQVDGASSYVKVTLSGGQISSGSVKVMMMFAGGGSTGARLLTGMRSVWSGSRAVTVGELKLWFALLGDKGVSGKKVWKTLDVTDDVPADAGFDGGRADTGFDAGFDAGADSGFDAGHDAGHDAGLDAGMDGGAGCDNVGDPCCTQKNLYCYQGYCDLDAGLCKSTYDGGYAPPDAGGCGYTGRACCEDFYKYCISGEEQNLICIDGTCSACGKTDEACCDDNTCEGELECITGICREPQDGGMDAGADAGLDAGTDGGIGDGGVKDTGYLPCSEYNANCCYGSAFYCNTGACSAGKCVGPDAGTATDGGTGGLRRSLPPAEGEPDGGTDGGLCGYIGMGCCPTDNYYCMGGPGQQFTCIGKAYCSYCGNGEQSCCTDKGDWCAPGYTCHSGTCDSCGDIDALCCLDPGTGDASCNDPNVAVCIYETPDYFCRACGKLNDPCCYNPADITYFCNDTDNQVYCDDSSIHCEACGRVGEKCCADKEGTRFCNDPGYNVKCNVDSFCMECGSTGQECCDGDECYDGSYCIGGGCIGI